MGYSIPRQGHLINCTLFYLYNDGGAKFNPVAESRFYNVTNLSGENLTIFIDLTKADATVGTQIVDELTSSDASTTPTKTSCADSINALHVV
ncbi:35743_t:CDS:2, partial [Gigaspora margarita]